MISRAENPDGAGGGAVGRWGRITGPTPPVLCCAPEKPRVEPVGMSRGETPHLLDTIQGDWRVERLGGLLPPMVGVWKRVRGDGGETCIGPLPAWPFRLEPREGCLILVYRRPFSAFVDVLRPASDGTWLGVATVGGRVVGRFRMVRLGGRRAPGRA